MIKGISGNYKVWFVFELAKELDSHLKESKYESLDQRVEYLIMAIANAGKEIKQTKKAFIIFK